MTASPTPSMVAAARGVGGYLRPAVAALGWCVVGGLAAVIGARLVAWDRWQVTIVADALGNFVFFPVWIVAPLALFSGRRALGLAACVVAFGHLALVTPELKARHSVSALPTDVRLRIIDANVYQKNPSMSGYAALIEANHPDIVTLEEASPVHREELAAAGALRTLPYQFAVSRFDSRAFVLASRFPLSHQRIVDFEGLPLVVQVDLALPGHTIAVWVVHTVAPEPSTWRQWSRELSAIAAMVKAKDTKPNLIVGDFNATWGNRGFRRLLTLGLTDAAAALGHPLQMTWSQTMPFLPPMLRIDHVLSRTGAVVWRMKTTSGPGSDHRALIADVAIR